MAGTTPRARLLTVATAIAIAAAIAAFVALKPSEGNATDDSFTRAADQLCVEEKGRIATLEKQTLQGDGHDVGAFASVLTSIVAEWRAEFQGLPVSSIHAEEAGALDSALLEVLIQAGALARVTRGGSPAQIVARAQHVEGATAEVDRQIEQLGLERCSEVEIDAGV